MTSDTNGRSTLQNKAKSIFGEVCIDKGLFLDSGMLSRSIPTFLAEWILDRFCPDSMNYDGFVQQTMAFSPAKLKPDSRPSRRLYHSSATLCIRGNELPQFSEPRFLQKGGSGGLFV